MANLTLGRWTVATERRISVDGVKEDWAAREAVPAQCALVSRFGKKYGNYRLKAQARAGPEVGPMHPHWGSRRTPCESEA